MFMIITLVSCNNEKKELSEEKERVVAPVKAHGERYSKDRVLDDSFITNGSSDKSELHYFFSNDTLCQTLKLTKVGKDKIPKELVFKLILLDKLGKYELKEFDGVAKLFSSEETFYDASDKDSGDYFAGDYIFTSKNYEIQIRVDIEDYEASVVSIRTKQPDAVLGGYKAYLKTFPDQGVMKKGNCVN